MNSDVTFSADFNRGERQFGTIAIGDTVKLDDYEGMRCRATVRAIRPSEHVADCVIIDVEPDWSTVEHYEREEAVT